VGAFEVCGFPEAETVRIEQEGTEETEWAARRSDSMHGRRRSHPMARPLGSQSGLAESPCSPSVLSAISCSNDSPGGAWTCRRRRQESSGALRALLTSCATGQLVTGHSSPRALQSGGGKRPDAPIIEQNGGRAVEMRDGCPQRWQNVSRQDNAGVCTQ